MLHHDSGSLHCVAEGGCGLRECCLEKRELFCWKEGDTDMAKAFAMGDCPSQQPASPTPYRSLLGHNISCCRVEGEGRQSRGIAAFMADFVWAYGNAAGATWRRSSLEPMTCTEGGRHAGAQGLGPLWGLPRFVISVGLLLQLGFVRECLNGLGSAKPRVCNKMGRHQLRVLKGRSLRLPAAVTLRT